MSHRYSREQKGKAPTGSNLLRKPLVKIPESDVSELVDRNKFTLIGRVTNPRVQKTRALVDFFLQQWNVVAWDSTTGNCGLGWFLRDAGKLETEGFSSHRRYVPSALVAEALAVKAAVATAVSSHVNRLTVNSDSKNLVLLLRNQGQDVALRGLLHDIRVLARSLLSISFVYVPRLANTQADSLAKAALASFSSPAIVVD